MAQRAELARQGALPTGEAAELIESLIARDEGALDALSRNLKALDDRLTEVNAALGKAEEAQKAALALQEAEKELGVQQKALAHIRKALSDADGQRDREAQLGAAAAALEARYADYDARDNCRKEYSSLEKAIAESKTRQDLEEEDLRKKQEALAALREEFAALAGAGAAKERLLRELETVRSRSEALQSLLALVRSHDDLLIKLRSAQEDYLAARESADAVQQEYEEKNRFFLNEQAGVLAAGLRDGERCPVCGSEKHPHPARLSPGAPSEAEVARAKKAADAAQSSAAEKSRLAGELRGRADIAGQEIEKRSAVLLPGAAGQNRSAVLEKMLSDGAVEASHLEEAIRTEEINLQRRGELEKTVPAAEAEAERLRAAIHDRAQNNAAQEARAYADHLPFADKAAACEEVLRLKKEQEDLKAALSRLEEEHAACLNSISRIQGRAAQLREQLASSRIVDNETLSVEKKQLEISRQSLAGEQTALHTRKSANETALQNIRAKAAELSALEQRYTWVRSLSNTANGTLSGKEKIMLETYVQMTYFDRIIARANTRFMVMSSGQYELIRRPSADNNRSQSGLELDVIDHYNGTTRSVKTLSGGESFKASLSLALGLSDEVQSSAGGIRLDTMFVDEGFGSLDEESLRQAIRALSSLTESNRLVGIISHVDKLNESIPQKILVTNTGSGSTVKMIQ